MENRLIDSGDLVLNSVVDGIVELESLDVTVEDEGVGRSSESKHTKELTLLDSLTLSDLVDNTGDLSHTDLNDAEMTDVLVIGFDNVDLAD